MNDNPMGLDGFGFVEFSAPEPGHLESAFARLGFVKVAAHRSKAAHLWRQGNVNFIVNYEPGSLAYFHAEEHGPCACGFAFQVADSQFAYRRAVDMGAQPLEIPMGPMELRLPAIKGIGGAPLYLIDRFDLFDIDFRYFPGIEPHAEGLGLREIDHLTHNVYRGRMDYWAEFYRKYFSFREIRYFDLQGEQTGLLSRAMTAPDNRIRIPLNEEGRGSSEGQIEEYLLQHNGEGIQHIAFACEDLIDTFDKLKAAGVDFMTPPPDTYYAMLEERLPGHGEEIGELHRRGILLDGSTRDGEPRLLLQIFSETMIGPIFFEFIQRKGDEGFGEGNFQALFESMERDQMIRGLLESSA